MGFWNLLNENCSDISGWIDLDTGSGESTQVTFDSKSCFKFDTKTTNNSMARRAIEALPVVSKNFIIDLNLYCDKISSNLNNSFLFFHHNGIINFSVQFQSDGLFIFDGSQYNEVGTDLVVQDQWQKWRFEITGGNLTTSKCNVYLDDILVGSNIDCSFESGPAGGIEFRLSNSEEDDLIVYVDYVKISGYPLLGSLPRFYKS